MHQNVVFEQHYDVFVHFYKAHSQTHYLFALGSCVKTCVSLESGHPFDEMAPAESAEIAPTFLFYKKRAPRFLAYLTTLLPCFTQRVVQQI